MASENSTAEASQRQGYKRFRYRLYPSRTQRKRLEDALETCRRFYNDCLAERRAVYETEGRSVGRFEQRSRISPLRKSNPYAARLHTHVFGVVIDDIHRALDGFFRRIKAGEKAGYPRFKGVGRCHSFGFSEYGNGCKIDGRRLRLFGIGRIAVRWHRPIDGKIKTVRIFCKNGKWYATFSCEVTSKALPTCEKEVGVDLGLDSLLTLSTGEKIENPRWFRNSQKKLRVLCRAISRKKKGSNNRRKAVRHMAAFSEHVANQRKDYINKIVCVLIATFGKIAVEDLHIVGMAKAHFAKSIRDAGWGYFRQRLLDKAASAGRAVVLVEPRYTSQDCSQCGKRHNLTIRQRWLWCNCGNLMDRDENAALNILRLGRSLWASSSATAGFAQEAASRKR